jgi:hypothetical protein
LPFTKAISVSENVFLRKCEDENVLFDPQQKFEFSKLLLKTLLNIQVSNIMKSIVKMIMVNFVTPTVETGYNDKGPEVRNLVTMSL